jgi:hypothetical protein
MGAIALRAWAGHVRGKFLSCVNPQGAMPRVQDSGDKGMKKRGTEASMKKLFCMLLLAATPVLAQDAGPPQSLAFVQGYAQPSGASGKIPRWRQRICIRIQGFDEASVTRMTARVRTIAAEAGAPLDTGRNCKPNVEVYFTRQPQQLLAQLGLPGSVAQPIEAWYAGTVRDESGRTGDKSVEGECDARARSSGRQCSAAWNGSRLSTGAPRGELTFVNIVGDSGKLDSFTDDTLADHVALLALSQTAAFAACHPIASVANLLAPGCAHSAKALTAADRAYLKALYTANPDLSLQAQQVAISRQMESLLAGSP